MTTKDFITELALQFSHSQGWHVKRDWDTLIELDMTLPFMIQDNMHKEFLSMANVLSVPLSKELRDALEDPTQPPLKFKQIRLPQNILINLYDGDEIRVSLTKKPSADPSQMALPFPQEAGRVVEMFPDKAA